MPDPDELDAVPDAVIPVERIDAPILLISAEHDEGYGVALHEIAARRLAAADHPHPWRHIVHPGAGHLIAAPPHTPTTSATSPGPGITFRHGGTPAADAAARAATWHALCAFLTETLADTSG